MPILVEAKHCFHACLFKRNQYNQHCIHSVERAHVLNVNADYVDYVLGYSPKGWKAITWGEELLNKLCYYCFFCAQKVFS